LKIKWEGPKVFGKFETFETFIGCENVWAKEYTRFGDFIAFLLTSFVKISFSEVGSGIALDGIT